ncbi:MAG TPA: M20/M25/M40 family metallo-hydrolase [Gemmatimonadaceae bacterium]|nr:M20/M25/M40 family metallo-hydrolase [Gemmatimonadaceae bacterium]
MMRRPLSLAAAMLLVTAGARHATAQTFPTDDPIIKRIWAVGMDSSHTQQLAQVLFDSLGPRLQGTAETRAAQDWLVKTYTSWGIEAKNEQYGTWRGWRRGWSHIDLVSPRVRSLEATMVGYSPGTGGRDVTASTIILPRFQDSTAFVKWLPNARGKLVLVSAPMPTCRPTEDWAQNATPESRERMDSLRAAVQREWGSRNVRGTGYSLALGGGELGMRLDEAGVAGLLTSRPKNAWGTREIFETYNTKSPTLSLSCEDYGLVFRLTENDQHPQIRMNLDAQLLGEQPVFNTVAMIRGSEKPNEYVMLSAHFDSWDGSSGATDNGTGTLTMLEAMRILKIVYPHPKRTILVGHWTGEEEGEVGSKAFTEDHPDVLKGLQALFNQDNGTGRIVRMAAAGLPNADAHIRQWLDKVPVEFKNQINYGGVGFPAGGGSDDFSFSCAGLPAFGLGALPWDYSNYTWHTGRDTYDKVVFDDLKSNATLTAMLAYLASEDPTMITRERADLAKSAAEAQARIEAQQQSSTTPAARSSFRFRFPTRWPECEKAPRTTKPRLK